MTAQVLFFDVFPKKDPHLKVVELPCTKHYTLLHQQTAINHSSDSAFDGFKKFFRKCNADLFSFLFTDTTLPSTNPLGFLKNLLESV